MEEGEGHFKPVKRPKELAMAAAVVALVAMGDVSGEDTDATGLQLE